MVEDSLRKMRWELHAIRTTAPLGGALREWIACALAFRGGLHKLLRAWLARGTCILNRRMPVDGIDETVSSLTPIRQPARLPASSHGALAG